MVRLFVTLAVLAAAAGPPAAAAAQDGGTCMPPPGRGWRESFPASGARGVTLDSTLRVRYTEGFFDDPVTRAMAPSLIAVRNTTTSEAVGGRVDVLGDTLVFMPDAMLDSLTAYEAQATGGDFGPLLFSFTTGSAPDRMPPTFQFQPAGEDVQSERVETRCGPEGGYRIDVRFPPATDDGAPGDIEYLLFLTRGPTVEAGPELRARARNLSPDIVVMAFVIEPREAVSPICVVVQAVDGVGKMSEPASAPYCFDPIQGNFFEPLCAASTPERAGTPRLGFGTVALSGVLGALVIRGWRRVRRRPAPR